MQSGSGCSRENVAPDPVGCNGSPKKKIQNPVHPHLSSELSHDLADSSLGRVTKLSNHFESLVYKFESMWNQMKCNIFPMSFFASKWSPPEVYRIRISGLESGRIQHILNKPDRIRTTVLFKFPGQDQDFQISLFWDLTPAQS